MRDAVTLPRLLTEADVAQYLGVHPETVAPEDANLHDLRRKRLTDLTRERGVDFAQSLAAHSDPRMTQSYVSGEARVAI